MSPNALWLLLVLHGVQELVEVLILMSHGYYHCTETFALLTTYWQFVLSAVCMRNLG